MATQELVAFTTDRDESAEQQVGAGELHTLIPIFKGRPGAVVVKIVNSDGSLQQIGRLTSRPSSNKVWQLVGPVQYVVGVKNAGCDVDTGS